MIEDVEQYLHDTGLMFHINRTILHPLGLCLSLAVDDSEEPVHTELVLQETEDPVGFIFEEDEMKLWTETINSFLLQRKERVLTRGTTLKYIMQPPGE